MTDTLTFPLSTKAKRLVHDVQFATDIGRDSPFDPFQGRDITKLFSEKKEASMALMNFAQKQERRTMPTSIVFAKMPGREPVQSAFKSYYVQEPTATTYNPEVPLQGPHPHVSFPKAKRVLLENLGVTDILEKWQQPKNGAPSAEAGEERRVSGLHSNPEDLLSCRERATLRASKRSATPVGGMRPGVSIGKSGTGSTVSRKARASTPGAQQRPPTRQPAAKYQLPWEIEATAAKKPKIPKKPTGRLAFSSDPNIPTANFTIDGSPEMELDLSPDDTPEDAPLNYANANNANQDPTASPSNKSSQEEWLAKRHQMLSRFGLIGGSDTQNRKGGERRGVDFGVMPSRNAPIGYQRPHKEIHDNPYEPKDRVTTKTRAVAHVELGKQASRFQAENHMMNHINSLLNYEHLSKLHQRTREAEMKSLMGLSSPTGSNSYDGSGISTKTLNASPALDRPLTAADEIAYHFSSLQAPLRKRIPHTSDAYLWASREAEPLDSVLGGDPKPYKRAATKEVTRMSTPLSRSATASL